MPVALTSGCLPSIAKPDSTHDERPANPIVQLSDLKSLSDTIIKCTISDGTYSFHKGVLKVPPAGSSVGMEAINEVLSVMESDPTVKPIVQLTTYGTIAAKGAQAITVDSFEFIQAATSVVGEPVVCSWAELEAATATGPPAAKQVRTDSGRVAAIHHEPVVEEPTAHAQAPPPAAAAASTNIPTHIYPIASITPYQNKWTIRVRVTNKGGIRTYSNKNGEGKLFSVDFQDDSGEMRATGFNAEVDRIFGLLEEHHVYFISKCSVKPAKRQYSSINNDYELTFSKETEIIEAPNDVPMPELRYKFTKISALKEKEPNTVVDVIGVVKEAGNVATVMARKGGELQKRDVTIVDDSNAAVTLTLWNKDAQEFPTQEDSMIMVRGCKVGDYNGVSLSTLPSSQIQVNPTGIKEMQALQQWYEGAGKNMQPQMLSVNRGGAAANLPAPITLIGVAQKDGLGQNAEKADYFTVRAYASSFKKDNCIYMSCPKCNKKVVESGSSQWRCENCSEDITEPKPRLILQLNLADMSSDIWATMFQETAEQLLSTTVQELYFAQQNDMVEYTRLFTEATFKEFMFKIRAREETWQDERRVKYVVMAIAPVEAQRDENISYMKKMIAELTQLKVQQQQQRAQQQAQS